MNTPPSAAPSWRDRLPEGVRPYLEAAPLAALFLGISSGFPFALLAATLTNRLSEAGIDKKSIAAFALALLVYSFKWAWAPIVDRVRLPILSKRIGQRRAWLWLAGSGVAAAVIVLGVADPATDLRTVVVGALLLGFAGATFDIVISASDRACRNMAGGWAPSSPRRWRCSSRPGRTGRWAISPARPWCCRRCSHRR
jgi:PAT family beta-lactamase induction signal transducer AmpG